MKVDLGRSAFLAQSQRGGTPRMPVMGSTGLSLGRKQLTVLKLAFLKLSYQCLSYHCLGREEGLLSWVMLFCFSKRK